MANKAKPLEAKRLAPPREQVTLRADSQEPVRLRHLCKEDKAKIGELLQVMVSERSRSKECLRRYATDMKEYQATMRRLKKQNRRLSKERENLQEQLQQSMLMLAQCQHKEEHTSFETRAGESRGKNNEMLQTCELGETFGTSRFRPDKCDEEAQTCLPDYSKENSARPSAVGEVKSLRQDLANLSLSLRQLNGSAMEGRAALAPLQLNDSAFNPSALQSKRTSSRNSTRKNPLLLESSTTNEGRPSERREFSPRPNPVATPSTLPSTSFLHSPRLCQYDDSLFDLLEELESGSIAHPTPKHSSPDSDLAYSAASSFYSARKLL